jgi:DNA-binding GntR family transcriptional regulator
MDRAFKRSDTKPLSLDIIQVGDSRTPNDIRTFFGVENGDKIGRIRRIVTMNGVSYLYENYLWPDMARHITKKELAKIKSIQEILRQKIGLVVTKGEMYLEAIPAEPDISEVLQCQSFDPLIHIQTYFWVESERPFEIVNVYFRSCYFKYKVEVNVQRV